MRVSLVPTKSVNVNINNVQYTKYMVWFAKVLFYICILNIVSHLITKWSKHVGFNLSYVIVFLIILLFGVQGQMHRLIF